MGTIIARLALSKSTLSGKSKISVSQGPSLRRKLTIVETGIAIQPILNYSLDEDNYVS